MNRDMLIKFFPEPTNSEVIVYDINLKDLIDVNVIEEYNKIFPIYTKKEQEYNTLKKLIEEYQNTINNIYLYNTSWSKEDYLKVLQDDKRTYNNLFTSINKIENNIITLKKNIKAIDEKITIQTKKDEKEIVDKKNNIDKDIETNKNKLFSLKNKLKDTELELEDVNEKIENNNKEFEIIQRVQEELESGNFCCPYCGTKKTLKKDSPIHNRNLRNLEKNKNELEKLQSKQSQLNNDFNYYKNEITMVKTKLNNDLEFKKQDYNFYHKKSVEILKLEGLRDKMINDIGKLEKQLKTYPELNSLQYKKLKENISKYELSLENLEKISEIKINLQPNIDKFKILRDELNDMYKALEKYKKFLTIYYKIYEKKANEYFGENFKFKIFKFDNFTLIPMFELYYKNTEYTQLNEKYKKEVEDVLYEKIYNFI